MKSFLLLLAITLAAAGGQSTTAFPADPPPEALGYICGVTDSLNFFNTVIKDPINLPKRSPVDCSELNRWLENHNLRFGHIGEKHL